MLATGWISLKLSGNICRMYLYRWLTFGVSLIQDVCRDQQMLEKKHGYNSVDFTDMGLKLGDSSWVSYTVCYLYNSIKSLTMSHPNRSFLDLTCLVQKRRWVMCMPRRSPLFMPSDQVWWTWVTTIRRCNAFIFRIIRCECLLTGSNHGGAFFIPGAGIPALWDRSHSNK